MKDKILTGTITDVETGVNAKMEPSYFFSNGYGLNAIVKIMCARSYFHDTREVQIDCLALDWQGEVFKLHLCFMPQCLDEEQKIISEITAGKILVVIGRYCVLPGKESIITLYDPQYVPLPPEISLEEVEEVFRFNSTSMIKTIQKAAKRGNEFARRNLDYMYEQGHTETVKPPMEDSMKDKILTGTITNMETGETHDMEPFYMFLTNCQLNAIAKIQCVKSYFYSETDTREVQINCWALDCQGNVFKLNLYFLPECIDEEQKIISEITEGKILVVSGQFTVIQTENNVTLYDVEYSPLPPEISLEEAEEVFRFNVASMIKDIHKAAEQGDIDRQIELGYMYYEGRGVSQDYSEAAKWFLMAAEQGEAKAQYNMGDMYKEGEGVPQDYDEAAKWYLKAAKQGYKDAQLELDKMKDK